MPSETGRSSRLGLTRSGKIAAALGLGVLIVGRLAGIEELSVAGLCLLALVVCSVLVLRASGTDLVLRRQVRPRRVEAGDHFTISLQVHNGRSSLRLPLQVTDRLDGRPVAQVTLP